MKWSKQTETWQRNTANAVHHQPSAGVHGWLAQESRDIPLVTPTKLNTFTLSDDFERRVIHLRIALDTACGHEPHENIQNSLPAEISQNGRPPKACSPLVGRVNTRCSCGGRDVQVFSPRDHSGSKSPPQELLPLRAATAKHGNVQIRREPNHAI